MNQTERVLTAMKDGGWRAVADISKETGDPEPSVSCQLRHLRKPHFGGYVVEKKWEGEFYVYRVKPRGNNE